MLRNLILAFFLVQASYAQIVYPKDYFRNPLDIPMILSGSFGELRATHFHAGLDIKTQGAEGKKVYASASGYVSRIKIAHFGYGKALYITHPNGYTTVYGHLKKLSKRLEAYIKMCQYERESFEVEIFPDSNELLIEKDEVIAYSGNTGSSGGPHLHFEIRDNKERPINPMLFGLTVKDTRAPYVTGIYAYPKEDTSSINGKHKRLKLRLIPKKNGDYEVEKIKAYGTIGFGIIANDKQDLAANRNGLSEIHTFFNGNKQLSAEFSRISFAESKHIKRYVDYEYYKTKKRKIQKLFIENNNPLSIFKYDNNSGYIKIEDSTSSVFKIRVKDFNGNDSWVSIPIQGAYAELKDQTDASKNLKTLIVANELTTISEGNFEVNFYKNTFYDDMYLDYKINSDTLDLGKDVIPLRKNFDINLDITNYKTPYKNRLYIARLFGSKNKPYYVSTVNKGNILSGKSKSLGKFTLAIDTIAPTITATNFTHKKWLSKYRYLKLKINDEDSGISKYRATVNGKWILMEYDHKTKTLTHDFNDNVVTDITNNLKVIVTDNVGNSSTFEATFYRKNKNKSF